MSKKIAQLTRVIYQLHTKNDESKNEVDGLSNAYELEIDEVRNNIYCFKCVRHHRREFCMGFFRSYWKRRQESPNFGRKSRRQTWPAHQKVHIIHLHCFSLKPFILLFPVVEDMKRELQAEKAAGDERLKEAERKAKAALQEVQEAARNQLMSLRQEMEDGA